MKAPKGYRVPISSAPLTRADYGDKPTYVRKPLSNYEGYKRLDKSLEKIATRAARNSEVCDVCHRRVRAWRVVPHIEGHKLAGRAGRFGKVLLCCDTGPEACAATLTRAGCVKQAVEVGEAMKRLGLVLP